MLTASPININERDRHAALSKAMLLMIAIALNAVELAVPRLPFFPWLKPGFANIITVLWIVKYGFKDALLFTALRVWISGFYFGFSLFTLTLGIAGGLLSTAAMSLLWISLGRRKLLGAVGMAVAGALFHNAGQLAVVYFMMSGNMGVLGQIPFMLAASVAFGSVVGALAPAVAGIVDSNAGMDVDADVNTNAGTDINTSINTDVNPNNIYRSTASTFIDKSVVLLTFAVSISLMFVNNLFVLVSAAALFSLVSLILVPKKPGVIFYPLRFYMLFIFIAFTHFVFSYGTRIDVIPVITKEGLSAFINQSLRLWCWLQTIHIFKKFNFDAIFMNALRRFFPNQQDTLKAGMIALKHFPEIARISKSNRKIPVTAIFFRPRAVLSEYVTDISRRVSSIAANRSTPPPGD